MLIGPLAFLVLLLLPPPQGIAAEGHLVLATTAWMAIWWLTEAVPIFATALIPLVVFPLGKAVPASQLSSAYMDSNIVLFMGGFFLAMSIRKWKLHRRIALGIIAVLGGNPTRLILGFMAATAFLSMWVSNTATAIMMLPIGIAVVRHLEAAESPHSTRFAEALFLGIAYSASIGGIATLIGTPPNIVFVSQYTALFPNAEPIGFGQWMALGLPFVCVFLLLTWFYLTRVFSRLSGRFEGIAELISAERRKLGPMSRGEKLVTVVFVLTALGWVFRSNIVIGSLVIPGWAELLGIQNYVHDSTVAIASSLLLFAIPVHWRKKEFLLDWETAVRIPWGILLLFGGGIALARAFQATGLAAWAGSLLEVLQGIPLPLLVLAVSLTVTFMTELTSNTATASIFMPILAGTATTLGVSPELLMIPATISASCAFMLPVATPPNAIVFGSDCLTIGQMARAGFWLNLIGAVLVTLFMFTIGIPVFGIEI